MLSVAFGVIGGSSLTIAMPSGAFVSPGGQAITYSAKVLVPEHTELHLDVDHNWIELTVAAKWMDISEVGLAINATGGTITGAPQTLDYTADILGINGTRHDSAYQLEVIGTNAYGSASATFTLTNTFAPPALAHALANHTVDPGQGAVAIVQANTFTDPYDHGLTYSATLTSGAALPAGLSWGGSSIVIGKVAAGSYGIKVIAKDGLGHTASTSFTLTVRNAAPVIGTLTGKSATQGATMTAFTMPAASDPNGDAMTYSASGMPSGVVFTASTRKFSGKPTVSGSFTVTYKATDSHGLSTSKTFLLTVAPAPPPGPPVYHGGIDSTVEFSGGGATFTIPVGMFTSSAGLALTYSASFGVSWMTFSASTRTFTARTVRYTSSDGVTLTVTDSQGHAVTVHFQAEVIGTMGDGGRFPPPGGDGAEAMAAPLEQPIQDPTNPPGGGGGDGGDGGGGTPPPAQPNVQAYWFTYDADNRVAISNGALVGGAVVLTTDPTSYELDYDAAGNEATRVTLSAAGDTMLQASWYDTRNELVRADYSVDQTQGGGWRGIEEARSYDAAGHLLATEQFYAGGTHLRPNLALYWKTDPDEIDPGDLDGADVSHMLVSATVDHYDADGRLLQEQTFGHARTWDGTGATGTVPGTLPAVGATAWAGMQLQSQVTYTDSEGQAGYDAAGNVTAYRYQDVASGRIDSYTVLYQKKDGYLERSTSGTSSDSNFSAGTDVSYYNVLGERIAITEHEQLSSGTLNDTARVFAYDAAGQILERRDGSVSSGHVFTATGGAGTQHYAYANGQQVGSVDEAGAIHVLDGLTAFSNSQSGSSGYVVQIGDTLKSIAQAAYGNASLWYVVAQANGLDSDDDLAAGQSLSLPQVTTNSNDATTFKPYDPAAITGSTTPPTVYAPPPPPPQHCNVLAEIVVIAVVVAVSYFTAGAAASAGWGYIGSGAAAGAAGSAAGQLAGDALGVHQGFSLSEVAVGAAGGAIGGAVSHELTGYDAFTRNAGANGLNTSGNAVAGAAGYAGSYAASKVVSQPAHFSWVGLVASATGSAAGGTLGATDTDVDAGRLGSDYWGNIEARAVEDIVTRETSVALGDNHVQGWEQLAEDVFGNALGNAAVAGINRYTAGSATPASASSGNPLPPIPVDPLAPDIGMTPMAMDVDGLSQAVGPASLADTAMAAPMEWSAPGFNPEDGPPVPADVPVLPSITVTPDARFNADYLNLWEWAQLNQQTPPPPTASQAVLNAYRDQAYAATAPAYRAWQQRTFPATAASQPVDPYTALYDTINGGAGKVLETVAQHLYAYTQAGAPGGTVGSELGGFMEAGANLLTGLANLGMQASPYMQVAHSVGYDYALPTFQISNDQLAGAAVFDVASLGLGGVFAEGADGARAFEGLRDVVPDARAAGRMLPAIGGRVPNAGGVIREFVQPTDQVYYRVFTDSTTGNFLTAVPPRSSTYAMEGLALPPENIATFIQEVRVPTGTSLLRSRAISAFGRRGGAEQFELLNHIPTEYFGPGRPLP